MGPFPASRPSIDYKVDSSVEGGVLEVVISAEALEKIEKFAESNGAIVAAHVFGSSAAGRERRGSDVDISIMIRGSMDGFERVRLETELSNLIGKDADLVIFGLASPLLQHQILQYGRLVYEADRRERIRQETAVRREYLDSLVLYRMLRQDSPMVDKELVSRKLSRLRMYVDELRMAQDINWLTAPPRLFFRIFSGFFPADNFTQERRNE